MVAAQAVAVVFQFATVRDGSGWGSKGGKRWRWYKCVHNQKGEIKMNLKKITERVISLKRHSPALCPVG